MDLGEWRHLGKWFEFLFRSWVSRRGQPVIDIDIKVCIPFSSLYFFIRILFVRGLFLPILLLYLYFLFFHFSIL